MICNSCPFFTTPKRWCSTLLAGNTQVNPFPHFTKFGFWCSALLVESTLTYICSGYMCLPFWILFQGKARLGFHFGENTNAIGMLGKSNSSRGKRLNLIKVSYLAFQLIPMFIPLLVGVARRSKNLHKVIFSRVGWESFSINIYSIVMFFAAWFVVEVWGFQRYYYIIEFCWESVCGDIDGRKCVVEEGYRFKVWTKLGELGLLLG